MRQANELVRETGTCLKPLPAGTLPGNWVSEAHYLLHAAPRDEAIPRLESFTTLAVLTDSWAALAAVAMTLAPPALLHMVSLPGFVSTYAHQLMEAQPSLHESLRAAVFARFNAARPGWRYHELVLVCCFAPHAEAFELGLAELRLRASAGMEMAMFAEHDPSRMPRLVSAAFENARSAQVDAFGFKSLFLANPQAFAAALSAEPATVDERLKRLKEIFRALPSSRDGDHYMTMLQDILTERRVGKE